MRQRYYQQGKECNQCGEWFEASRFDAKFCGGQCRSKHYRVQLKRSQQLQRIKEMMSDVLRDCKTAESYMHALAVIQECIDAAQIEVI